jgi:hypothetical protein
VLEKTSIAWSTFKRENLDKFTCQSLSAIEATFARLEAISREIKYMDKRCCKMRDEVSVASQSEDTSNCEVRG